VIIDIVDVKVSYTLATQLVIFARCVEPLEQGSQAKSYYDTFICLFI